MKGTLISAAVVGFLSMVGGVVAVLTVGEPQTERVERISRPAPKLVEVPVVAQDLPTGTKITTQNVAELFVLRQFPKDDVPPNALLKLRDLSGTLTTRGLHQGEVVQALDLTTKGYLDPPEGTTRLAVPILADRSTSGFLLPGYKVVVVAVKESEAKGKEVVLPLLLDVLILDVDEEIPGTMERPVSFAVTPEQHNFLTAVIEGGATIRVALPFASEGPGYFGQPREYDTRILLPLAQSLEDVRSFLDAE